MLYVTNGLFSTNVTLSVYLMEWLLKIFSFINKLFGLKTLDQEYVITNTLREIFFDFLNNVAQQITDINSIDMDMIG